MTNKVFYQAAAAEVVAGHLDEALWIKVNAELPSADDKVRQAKYVALRAEEMAVESAKRRVLRWMPRSVVGWLAYAAVAFAAFMVVGALVNFLALR